MGYPQCYGWDTPFLSAVFGKEAIDQAGMNADGRYYLRYRQSHLHRPTDYRYSLLISNEKENCTIGRFVASLHNVTKCYSGSLPMPPSPKS